MTSLSNQAGHTSALVQALVEAPALQTIAVPHRASVQRKHFATRSSMHGGSTVTITGTRGSGKTTVLVDAMTELSARADMVVLPIIRPEIFGPEEGLIGVMLEYLADWIRNVHPTLYQSPLRVRTSTELPDEELPTDLWLDRLMTWEAATRPTLRASAVDIDQRSLNTLAATRRAMQLTSQWRPVLDSILKAVQAETGVRVTKLVVPIDDADLVPAHLPALMTDLRWLDEHRLTTCVVCIDERDLLRQMLKADADRAIVRNDDDEVATDGEVLSVIRRIEKALPPQNRVRLQPWDPSERLEFQPNRLAPSRTRHPSLEQLLQRAEVPGAVGAHRLSSYFGLPALGGASVPSQFADALPDRPRALERLYQELDRIGDDSSSVAIIDKVLSVLGDEAQAFLGVQDSTLFRTRADSTLRRATLDLTNWEFFGDREPLGRRTIAGTRTTVRFTTTGKTGARIRQSASEKSLAINPAAVAFSLLVLDIDAASDYFDELTVLGSRPYAGADHWHEPRVDIDGENTDNSFMRVPPWEGYIDYFLLHAHLRQLASLILERHDDEVPRSVIEWYFLSQVAAILAIQRNRTLPKRGSLGAWVSPLLPTEANLSTASSAKRWASARDEVLRGLKIALTNTYVTSATSSAQREVDFVNWFERWLLMVCFSPLISNELTQWLIDLFDAAATKAGRASSAHRSLKTSLDNRLTTNSNEAWIHPILTLGQRLGYSGYDVPRPDPDAEALGRVAADSATAAAADRGTGPDGDEVSSHVARAFADLPLDVPRIQAWGHVINAVRRSLDEFMGIDG